MQGSNQKQEFYEQLQSALDKTSNQDVVILMGDMNAKTGQDNTGYERIMGRHGTGVRNENGEMFLNFCNMNDLVVGGSKNHKEHHKKTWIAPDGRTDHLNGTQVYTESL